MGKRLSPKHAASGARVAAARLRFLLVAALCGGMVFFLNGFVLGSANVATRVLVATGVTLVGYAGFRFAKRRLRSAQAGRRRAVVPAAAPVAEQERAESAIVDEEVENLDEAAEVDAAAGEVLADVDVFADSEDDMPGFLLEQLMQQAMDEELDAELSEVLAYEPAQDQREEALEDQTPEPAFAQDTDVLVPDVVTHELVPISSLYEARAEAERLSLQRFQATVRGLGVRTGDDPVAVDVLARVVAAVDRLTVTESFERPVLSETGPLLAAAAAAPPATPPAREATPLPSVPTMRPSDMPVTELSSSGLSLEALPEEILDEEAPAPDTEPIEAVVVEDPDLVLPIPAPPRPQPAHRRRRLRRNSVA